MRRTLRTPSFLVLTFSLFSVSCLVPAVAQVAVGQAPATPQRAGAKKAPSPAKLLDSSKSFPMLLAKLNESTEMDFFETPLEDVVREISDRHGVIMRLDVTALGDSGLSADTPVTFELQNVKLGTALDLMLGDLELVLSAHDNVFVVSSLERERMITRVYTTDGLVPENADWEHLIDTITSSVHPDSWEELGGSGTISVYQRNLVVSQGFETHVKLDALLTTLRKNIENAGGPQPTKEIQGGRGRRQSGGGFGATGEGAGTSKQSAAGGGGFFQIGNQTPIKPREVQLQKKSSVPGRKPVARNQTREEKIEKELESTTSFEFFDTPLEEITSEISKLHGIAVVIDKKALEELALESTEPITKTLNGISLRSALRLMLADLELTYVVADEVLMITSEEFAQGELVTKIHDVRPLIMGQGDEVRLLKLLTGTIDPDTWEELGGAGTMYGYYGLLVVSTTQEVHEKLATLITDLHAELKKSKSVQPIESHAPTH